MTALTARSTSNTTSTASRASRDTTLVQYCIAPDLLWAEIDDKVHLARARDHVYPAIQARELME